MLSDLFTRFDEYEYACHLSISIGGCGIGACLVPLYVGGLGGGGHLVSSVMREILMTKVCYVCGLRYYGGNAKYKASLLETIMTALCSVWSELLCWEH